MPIYDYKCRSCDEVFEKLVKNRDVKVVCKKCGAEDVQRLLSAFSVGSSSPAPAMSSCPKAASGQCGGCGV